MILDTALCRHLAELVVACDLRGRVEYANPAALHWCDELVAQPFVALLTGDSAAKGQRFLEAARACPADAPSDAWELTLGAPGCYSVARFRGYRDGDTLVALGQVEPEQVGALQREMLALTSELTEAQRDQRRQNRALQQALDQQRRLLDTINDLTAPAVRLWDGVLLLPIVGQLDSHRAGRIVDDLLGKVGTTGARHVILDVSGIASVDTAVARLLIATGQALRLLGATPILVGINPEIAQTLVHLGVELSSLVVRADLQSALAAVLRAGAIGTPQPPPRHSPGLPRTRH